MERLLSTQEAAVRAGVGPTAIKRWADLGLLPCVRTAGGHRRFREGELSIFLARQASPPAGQLTEVQLWLEAVLDADSGHEVEASLLALRGQHGAWHRAATFIGAVLDELGARWARGELSVIEEHLTSERLLRAINRVSENMQVAMDSPVVLLTTVEGDEHLLGLALVELCVREHGLRTRWTGRSTPVEEVVRFLDKGGTAILAVSASTTAGAPARLQAWLDRIIPVCRAAGVDLVLGGEGAWPEAAPFAIRLRTFDELHAFLLGRQTRPNGANQGVNDESRRPR